MILRILRIWDFESGAHFRENKEMALSGNCGERACQTIPSNTAAVMAQTQMQ